MRPFVFMLLLCWAGAEFFCPAVYSLEKGAILYHTSKDGEIYGATDRLELTCSSLRIALGELGAGHVALYIGDGKIIHAVLGGIEETLSSEFITADDLANGVQYLGAKIPVNYNDPSQWPEERKDQLILIAKEQVGKGYDITFHRQTGPGSGDFTCVGLVEYVYEQAGYPLTPEGYYNGGAGGKTYTQVYHCSSTLWQDWEGVNTFSETTRFSLFHHPLDWCCGREYESNKYLFFPYTQYLQQSTESVDTDIPVSGSPDSGGCFIRTVQ